MADDVIAEAVRVLTETEFLIAQRSRWRMGSNNAERAVEALRAAGLLAGQCQYVVSSDEGTSYCSLNVDQEALTELQNVLVEWRRALSEVRRARAERDEALRTLDAIRALCEDWTANRVYGESAILGMCKLLDGSARPVPAQPESAVAGGKDGCEGVMPAGQPPLYESHPTLAGSVPAREAEPATGGHSRACGYLTHEHGPKCHPNCPTCHGVGYSDSASGRLPQTPPIAPPIEDDPAGRASEGREQT